MRIKLLDRLREGDATVGELQEALGASQQNVSKHLGHPPQRRHGQPHQGRQPRPLLDRDRSVFELCEQVCGGVRRQLDELDALLAPSASE